MQLKALVGEAPSERATHGRMRRVTAMLCTGPVAEQHPFRLVFRRLMDVYGFRSSLD